MKKILLTLALALTMSFQGFAYKLDSLTINTTNLPGPEKITVVTPDIASKENPVPTVYLLHGYGGDQMSWLKTQPKLKDLADKYGVMLVVPDGRNTWYVNSPEIKGQNMETFMIDELVPYIDKKYPTIKDKNFRAITGLSMGGHGAMKLALQHPDIFGTAGSTSGGVNIYEFPESWQLPKILGPRDENPERWKENAVYYIVDKSEPNSINIIFDCGVDDFFAPVNNALHQKLLDKKWNHDYISRPGNHSQSYWRNSILYQMLYFNEIFTKNAAESAKAKEAK